MSTERRMVDLSARCACEAVRMRVVGPVVKTFLCTCEDCQRATGAGHSAAALVPAESLAVEGEARGFGVTADSGATFTRHFCPTCGTPLFGISSRAPRMRLVPIGFFTGSNGWFAPEHVIFARTHREWDDLPADVPRHATYWDE